jgi:hypothetical protein
MPRVRLCPACVAVASGVSTNLHRVAGRVGRTARSLAPVELRLRTLCSGSDSSVAVLRGARAWGCAVSEGPRVRHLEIRFHDQIDAMGLGERSNTHGVDMIMHTGWVARARTLRGVAQRPSAGRFGACRMDHPGLIVARSLRSPWCGRSPGFESITGC